MEIVTITNFALRLGLKERLNGTREWPTGDTKLKLTINKVKCWFLRRGEIRVSGENLSVQSREPKTQPTYDAGSGS